MATRSKSPMRSPLPEPPEISRSRSPSTARRNIYDETPQTPNSQSIKRTREPDNSQSGLKLLKLPDAEEVNGNHSQIPKSPPKSPRKSPRIADKIEFKLEPLQPTDVVEEIKFEEFMRSFEYGTERSKAIWYLPLKNILMEGKNDMKMETEVFPENNKKKWKLIAEIDKEDKKILKLYAGLECVLDDKEKKNIVQEWKRDMNIGIRLVLKRGTFDVDKTFNRTFSNKCNDAGFILQEKNLADINLENNDCLIMECNLPTDLISSSSMFKSCLQGRPFDWINKKLPFSQEKTDAIPTALQKLFYNLKYSKKPVSTSDLIKSFGWDKKQAWVQQDVQEFCCLLLEALDEKTKGIEEVDGAINELFQGQVLNYVRCMNVDYESERIEKFLEVQLMVKGMQNIYHSLDLFVLEECLDGDNMYDAGEFGLQDAKKGIQFANLPPVLMIQLKRFEYDYEKETNVKITDHYEYYDELDLKKYVRGKYKGDTKYKLYSVLVHNGTSTVSGHYYAFIRPQKDGRWYKFNDDIVDYAEPEEVFNVNFGGTHVEAKINANKEIETSDAINPSSAYMLVYLRSDKIAGLLRPLTNEDVPQKLIEEIEKNKKVDEERRKKGEEYVKTYITSPELLSEISTPGLCFYKQGNKDEDFERRFLSLKSKRLKVYFKKNFRVLDIVKFISDNTGIPVYEIMVWKITIAREQITQVLKRNYLYQTGPNVQVLSCGVNSHQLKSIFIVHTFNKEKYPAIFLPREKYMTSFFDINCKNTLEFAQYRADHDLFVTLTNQRDSESSGSEKDNIKVEKHLEGADKFYTDVLDEKYLLIFIKIYSIKAGNPDIRMFDDIMIEKTAKVSDFLEKMRTSHSEMKWDALNIFREDKKKYILEPLKLEDPVDDKSAESGYIYVLEFKDEHYEKMDYISATAHYEAMTQRVWVNFIPKFEYNALRTILDGNIPYSRLVEIIAEAVFDNQVSPNKLLLKAKLKPSGSFQTVTIGKSPDIKLSEIVKYDERVHCEESKIDVNLLDKKIKVLVIIIYYYSTVSNARTGDEEIYLEKNATIENLLSEIEKKGIFIQERIFDLDTLNNEAALRVTLLEKKKDKLVGRAQNDMSVASYLAKYRLRLELIPRKYEIEPATEEERLCPIYCFHACRDGELFSNPFLIFAQRFTNVGTLKQLVYNTIKDWDINAEKKINVTEEYFAKLRFNMKSESSDTKTVKLEADEAVPMEELDKEAKKYFLELIHPFNMTTFQQMKIKY